MHSINLNPVSIIQKKRDGEILTEREIRFLIDRYTEDKLPDYQMSAFLMAAFLNPLNEKETSCLTDAMLHSGKVLDLSHIPGKKIDKHSTGGVGDKLSLILAPVVASFGIPVPMISGRGLGHTGGTLDKLESIPGFKVDMTLDRYQEVLAECGMVMSGQTEDIAPADKRIYALRDVTGTVESIPLIAGSIMSKKLAEGIDGLVLDVKFGSGAFMKNKKQALQLAETLVAIGERFNKETIAYITSMEQPLGHWVGNWFEVLESINALQGKGPEDVMEISHQLAGTMISMGGKADSVEEGIKKSKEAIKNGSAWEKWKHLVEVQGGDVSMLEHPESYPKAAHEFEVYASEDGFIKTLDARKIGMASLELGAGRRTKEDEIDFQAGIYLNKKIGDDIIKGETIARGFTNNSNAIDAAKELITESVGFTDNKPDSISLITYRVDKKGIREI